MRGKRIRVLCVDDAKEIADLYAGIIRRELDMDCAGTLSSADELVDEVKRSKVDVVLLDRMMPGKPPLEAVRELAQSAPDCRVIVYSGYDDQETIYAALQAGVWGYVSKHSEPDQVLEAIRKVANGEVVCSMPMS